MLNEILKMAERGLYLFPVDAKNKMPLTEHGFKDATTDKDQLKQWFKDANAETIGVALNLKKSGLVCLDIDNGHKGQDENAGTEDAVKLMGMNSDFTLDASDYVESTQSGGFHMFYKAPSNDIKKVNIMDHIELLVDSVLIAPTKAYKAFDNATLSPDISLAPSWMTGTNKPFKPKGKTIMYGSCKNIGMALNALYKPVPQGERHNTLVTITCSFFATGADVDVIQDLVYKAGERMGLNYDEIDNIWNWALGTVTTQLNNAKKAIVKGV